MTIGLIDIAPPEILSEEISIFRNGKETKKLAVHGVGADQWLVLYQRYPDLRGVNSGDVLEATIPPVRRFASQTALISAGLGKLGDHETEKLITERLTGAERTQIIDKIFELSLPGDIFGPLLNGEDHADVGEGSPKSPE